MSTDIAVIVIDVQVGIMREAYRSDEVLQNIKRLLERARAAGTPVIYVQHASSAGQDLEINTPGWQIYPTIAPRVDEMVVGKESPDAFYQTRLQAELEERGIKRLVIVGAQTQYCVDTTTRRAVSQGYDVLLASDAHTTFDNEILTAAQIVALHNETLENFWAGEQVVRVKPVDEIVF